MKSSRLLVALLTTLLTGALSAPISADTDPVTAVIVVLKDVVDSDAVAGDHKAKHGADISHVYKHALKGYAAKVGKSKLAAIVSDPNVAFISEDWPVSIADDGKASKPGAAGKAPQPAQSTPTGIDRIDAEPPTSPTPDATGPAVAVIDTGSGPHSDLNIAGGTNCSTGKSFNDGNGHGTHVAGTIAARNNGTGVVGVLPGAPIYSVRVLNNAGSGTWSSVICGIDWVTQNAGTIKVANMSLGGSGSDDGLSCAETTDALKKAICSSVAAGVTYVVAAGNSAVDLKDFVPATYDVVLSVTAVADFNGQPGGGAAATCRSDVDDTYADFSNFATLASDQDHTIAAPGVCIKSTWTRDGYNTISGTSMASPHAAGTVAVCIASGACAGLTPAQIIAKMRADAAARPASYGFFGDPNQPDGSKYFGHLIYAGGY